MTPDEAFAFKGEHVQTGPYEDCACGWPYGWCPTLSETEIKRRKEQRP